MKDPAPRTKPKKYDERRAQLAESALITLGERGYARTSLREIAQNSEFSHGVVHYYFADKAELIVHCVKQYKKTCVTRYDSIVLGAIDDQQLITSFADKLAETLSEDTQMHRLWYDLRTQAMFDPELREAAVDIDTQLEAMIWRVIDKYCELSGRAPLLDPPAAYALMDGLFEKALLAYLGAENPNVVLDALKTRVADLLPRLAV